MKKISSALLVLIFTQIILLAQNPYHEPESVTFDEVSNNYYISNYGFGNIVIIDSAYTVHDTLAENLSYCLGIHLVDNILYASCDRNLKGFDISTKEMVFNKNLTNTNWLDGITSDNSGNIYVVNSGGSIIKVNPADSSHITFATGFPSSCQDIDFDESNNRLLVVSWSVNSSIHIVDLITAEVESIPNTNIGRYDGITIDSGGNVYVSSHAGGDFVYRFESTFIEPPYEIASDFDVPAGLYYNISDDILVVPNFGDDRIDFMPIQNVPADQNIIKTDKVGLLNNYPNPFNPITTITFSIANTMNTEIIIYNIKGKKVRVLVNDKFDAGIHHLVWNGKDDNGKSVASGIYFYKMKSGSYTATRKMILMK